MRSAVSDPVSRPFNDRVVCTNAMLGDGLDERRSRRHNAVCYARSFGRTQQREAQTLPIVVLARQQCNTKLASAHHTYGLDKRIPEM